MSVLHIFLFLSLLYHHGLLASATSNNVSTKQGYVFGMRLPVNLHNGLQYTIYAFVGIPYAEPPVNQLRFKPPQSTNRTYSDRMFVFPGPKCWQTSSYIESTKLRNPNFHPSGDLNEDCLYLDIYTPSTNCTRKYPVMVYIHGGSYVGDIPIRYLSQGNYLPHHGVVLVKIHYRLGAFGFFTTGDSEAPGNLGLLDQIKALQWIQDNIGAFCGNKNSVTLLGVGAGGSSVSMHYLSSQSGGLFHRGIAVSGVALSPFAFKPKSTVLKASKILLKNLDCEKNTSKLTVECLQSKHTYKILENNKNYMNVQPFADNDFLSDEPRKLLKEGKFQKDLPLMSGFGSNEGTNGISEPKVTKIPADYEKYLDKLLFQKYLLSTKEQAPTAFNALAFQYKPWDDLENPQAYKKNVIDMLSDYTVIAPTHDVLSFHSDHGAKTYMFEFAHRSRHRTGKLWKGVENEDTTAYMFGVPLLKRSTRFGRMRNMSFDDDDRRISKMMVTLFTNFAKSGNPNTPKSGVQWIAFDTSNKAYLKIQRKSAMTSNYHPLRMGFWNSYFPKFFPCMERTSKFGSGRCKKSEAPKPSQSPNGESNPSALVRGAPK